ncbi:uncharacterized protein BO97DRAFT_280258 [Aspergillus homomorphus CBS 101889]|uniref:Myb-like domain-containing protein n=1 Tax=Aspergillus homomorphus (strain CBS 101889) TaxID=1450537 RepID=A0A395I3M7_ASPHC|nr:hypothetical protein BO97DRAFT_280258 [Aspergillus homomorphus CBS 101889]RAL14213.1 hypothetical protein BO97DRAFT_280258 [Aspergillus homomorphus CBS 101889]
MLLPSALSCDVRRPSSRARFTPNRSFSTPPPSDDDFVPSGNGLLGTCRALQLLLNGSPAPSPRSAKPERLQSPVQIRPAPSVRLRKPSSRQHQPEIKPTHNVASRITPQSPSSGALKRRRDAFESETEDELPSATTPVRKSVTERTSEELSSRSQRFATPKRHRHFPCDLPLGLSQSDFYALHSPPVSQSPATPAHPRQAAQAATKPSASATHSHNPDTALPSIEESEAAPAAPPHPDFSWTDDDDRRLVDLVLEKFQLSQRDWDECAEKLGKDQASVGHRWQALLGDGDIGLRRGGRKVRRRLDESWL